MNFSNANDKDMINRNKNGKTERDRKANISTHDDPLDKRKDSVLVEEVVVNQPGRSLAPSFSLIMSDLEAYVRRKQVLFNDENMKIIRNIFKEKFEHKKYKEFGQCQL